MASSYTTAFRAEAVKLVLEQHLNVPQAMPKQTLDKWVKLAQQGKLAGLDQHRVQPVDELSAEVARLKRELAESKMECAFLKKAAAYFAKESTLSTRS
jgi:transposase